MFSKLSLRLLLAAIAAFGITHLAIHAPSAAFGGPPPNEVASFAQILKTSINLGDREMYLLDSGNDSIIVADLDTQLTKTTIVLNDIEGAVADFSQNPATDELMVTSVGGLYGVDLDVESARTLFEDPALMIGRGVVADTNVPSDDAFFVDYSNQTPNLMAFGAGGVRTEMPMAGTGEVKDMFEQTDAVGASTSKIGGVQKGSAIVWTWDRDTLVDQDATLTGVNPTGATFASGDTVFVAVNNAGTGELHRVNINPAAFGFVSPAEKTYSDPAYGIAYSNGFLAVVTGSNSPTEAKINVFDYGDGSTLLEVGTLTSGTSLPAPYTPSIGVGWGGTYDDLIYVFPLAGDDAGTGSISGDQGSWDPAGAGGMGGGGIDGPETGGGHTNHSPHQCTGCEDETVAEGLKVNPSTPGRVEFATGEEIHVRPLFSVPGIGMDLDMVLTYRSQRDHDYRYGRNWYLNHDSRMRTEPSGDEYYRNGYGRHELYVKTGPNNYLAPHNYDTTLNVNAGARTVTDRFGTATTYNAAGLRTSVTDRYGNSITYAWTGDQLTQITDTRGKTYTLAYDGNGRMSSITDYGARTWTFEYDYRGCLRTITTPSTTQQPSGRVHRYSYSANNATTRLADNLVHIWSPKGDVVQTLEYDAFDLVTKETVGPGSWDISYDLPNSQTTVVDPSGNTTRWTFDSEGYPTNKEQFTKGLRPGEPTSYNTSYVIGPVSNLVEAVVYPRGNRVEYTFDSLFNLLQVVRKETNTTGSSGSDIVVTSEFNAPFNQRSKMTDPRGNVTTFTVDPNGNTTAVSRPTVSSPASQSIVETFTFDAQGRVTSATDGAGRKTDFIYYATGPQAGWLSSVVRDPAGLALTTTFAYDQFGNVTSVTDPRGNATTFTVDAEDFITQIEAPSPFNYKTKFFYDENGDLERKEVENRDRKGVLDGTTPWIITDYAYNEVSWRTSKTVPLTASVSAVTTYEYQDHGFVSKIVNAEGEETEILYDERDLLFQVTRGLGTPEATSTKYDYDLNGNLSKTTNGRGIASTRTHDLFDRTERGDQRPWQLRRIRLRQVVEHHLGFGVRRR